MSIDKQTIVITGGGTGGHIYPGIAIARAINEDYPEKWNVEFVGAVGGLEEKLIPDSGYSLHTLSIGRFHSSVGRFRQIKTLCLLPFSIFSALLLFQKIKPKVVLGVGGFASFPFLVASIICGARTYIWEANALPGLVNRKLGPWVGKVLLVFDESKKYFKEKSTQVVGLPVRSAFFKLGSKAKSLNLRVLVFGGSQGAMAINNIVSDMVLNHAGQLKNIDLIHQTGSRDYSRISKKYKASSARVDCREYIKDMPMVLNQTDLCICRSGASTVAEVCSTKVPALFIPLPTAADDHQAKNAKVVVDAGGALLLPQKGLTSSILLSKIQELRDQREKLTLMSEKLAQFDFSDVDKKIAQVLVGEFS